MRLRKDPKTILLWTRKIDPPWGRIWIATINVVYIVNIMFSVKPWHWAIALFVPIASYWSYKFGQQQGYEDKLNEDEKVLQQEAHILATMRTKTLVRFQAPLEK